MKKIAVIGHARHGKDEVSRRLAEALRLRWTSSSLYALEQVIMPVLGPKYRYASLNECYEDRVNHRKEWYDLIAQAAADCDIGNRLLDEYDIYCGCRSYDELEIIKPRLNMILWVDASKRVSMEDTSSCTVQREQATHTVDNNGSLGDLRYNLLRITNILLRG